jgi:FAD/FMN-containing dehydrogenase
VRGLVLHPATDGYEPTRAPFNALATGRPAAIVRPVDTADVAAAVRVAAEAIEPHSLRGGGYLNYAEVDQSAARVAAAFDPDVFARLRAIKRRYDPDNRFRHNGNIPPA